MGRINPPSPPNKQTTLAMFFIFMDLAFARMPLPVKISNNCGTSKGNVNRPVEIPIQKLQHIPDRLVLIFKYY